MLILYVLFAWVATPLLLEFLNRRLTHGGSRVETVIKGWPAWLINVIVCEVVAAVIMFLPGGWAISFTSVFLLTCVIYFGNQAFFNTVIKPLSKARTIFSR